MVRFLKVTMLIFMHYTCSIFNTSYLYNQTSIPYTTVAVGSATQISLFVSPLIVIVGWIANRPMTLNFPPFEIFLFILSVIVVSIILSYPKSNWLEGSMLVTTYMLIAVGFWFEKVVDYS